MSRLQDFFTEHLGHPWEFVDSDATKNTEQHVAGYGSSATVAEPPVGDGFEPVVRLPAPAGGAGSGTRSLEEETTVTEDIVNADLTAVRASADAGTQTPATPAQETTPPVPDTIPPLDTHPSVVASPPSTAPTSENPAPRTPQRRTGEIYTGTIPLTSLCPCTLIGHPCRHPEHCAYQQTCWKAYCRCPLLHVKATCMSIREGFECENARVYGKPCWFGHEAEGEDGRRVMAGRHAGHHGERGRRGEGRWRRGGGRWRRDADGGEGRAGV